ncbi:MAG TPA: hypothetical protein VK590_11670 [Saprospiraceae bacterium]|nr:hypothetical protein [Saprospiraceae bacterium]
MKFIILLFTLGLYISCTKENSTQINLKYDKLLTAINEVSSNFPGDTIEFRYDNLGREIYHYFSTQNEKSHDYHYDNLELTYFYTIPAPNFPETYTYKHKVTFYDDNFDPRKLKEDIDYSYDGTQSYKKVWDYDVEGKEIGYKEYSNGILYYQKRDYKYNGYELTTLNDDFNGSVITTTKNYYKYYKDFIRLEEYIEYDTDLTTIKNKYFYEFNYQGKVIKFDGYHYFNQYTFRTINNNYNYIDDFNVEYTVRSFSDHPLDNGNITKVKETYLR